MRWTKNTCPATANKPVHHFNQASSDAFVFGAQECWKINP